MKPYLIAPLFAAVLLASGCSTLGTIGAATTGSVSDVAPQAMISAKKALIAAHGLHEAAADVATAAFNGGWCISTCATKALDALNKSATALTAGDQLVALGDARGINDKVSQATALISTVQSLAGKN